MSEPTLVERLRINVAFLAHNKTIMYGVAEPGGSEPSLCFSAGEISKVRKTCSDAANRIYQLETQLAEADALVRRCEGLGLADPSYEELAGELYAYCAKYTAAPRPSDTGAGA